MQVGNQVHRGRSWRVHDVAGDSTLLDVWRLPVAGSDAPGRDFAAFVAMHEAMLRAPGGKGAAGFLFRVRERLGQWLSLDEPLDLSIPGCAEKSIRERLPEDQRADPATAGPFRLVYALPDERLYETSNRTVHALMHLGWVRDEGAAYPEMAVYVKERGTFGRAYMLAIAPFRHLVVYPSLMRMARQRWERAAGG